MSVKRVDRDTLDPVWNDYVESVVLDRVLRRRDALRRRRRRLTAGGTVLLGIGVAATAWYGDALRPSRSAVAMAPQDGESGTTLSFGDGSKGYLSDDATVFSLNRSDYEARLAQEAGKVRYSIVERARRSFVVITLHATVRTRGAVMTVEVAPSGGAGATTIAVESGTVSVKGAETNAVLSTGETLRLAGAASLPLGAAASSTTGEQ